jgi:hypothetical protein
MMNGLTGRRPLNHFHASKKVLVLVLDQGVFSPDIYVKDT